MNKNNLKKIFAVIAVALAVIAAIILAVGLFAVSAEDYLFVKIMVIIVALLCGALAGEFGFMCYIENEVKPNYFLYDVNTKRNIDVQKMTFDTINKKMNRYLSGYASSEGTCL